MRGERQLLRLGEYLLRRACQRLPRGIRQERYREWAAELPAILQDPQIRHSPPGVVDRQPTGSRQARINAAHVRTGRVPDGQGLGIPAGRCTG